MGKSVGNAEKTRHFRLPAASGGGQMRLRNPEVKRNFRQRRKFRRPLKIISFKSNKTNIFLIFLLI